VPDQFGAVGSRVAFTNIVLDAEQAVGDLLVSMPGAPVGASIRLLNGTNVVFNWRPHVNYAGTTNLFQIVVTDSAQPSISVTQTFVLVVPDYVSPSLGSPCWVVRHRLRPGRVLLERAPHQRANAHRGAAAGRQISRWRFPGLFVRCPSRSVSPTACG